MLIKPELTLGELRAACRQYIVVKCRTRGCGREAFLNIEVLISKFGVQMRSDVLERRLYCLTCMKKNFLAVAVPITSVPRKMIMARSIERRGPLKKMGE